MATILVIDDTENNRILLSRRFRPRGHEILLAGDAEEGIALAKAHLPGIILMDVGLPGMDGLEATRLLRSDPRTQDIAIVALTAHAMAHDREQALSAGCDAYQSKPIDFPSLFGKVDELLARQATPRAMIPDTEHPSSDVRD
jgi:CheY-like chemotaxis protein